MNQFTWLQSRAQILIALIGLTLIGAVLAVTGPPLASLYDSTVGACLAQGADCSAVMKAFLTNDNTLQTLLGIVVIVVPGLIGAFWGAPLVAREIESGTHRLVWTQSITRSRWLGVNVSVIGIAGITVTALLTAAVSWWAHPFDLAQVSLFDRFDQRGIVPLAYTGFAFALGVAAGILIRRTLPALAATLAGYVGARFVFATWLRPNLLATAETTMDIRSAPLGFSPGPVFVYGNPTIPDSWVVSTELTNRAGDMATAQTVGQFLDTNCPMIANPPTGTGGDTIDTAGREAFENCLDQLSETFQLAVTYQPPDHYWPLQWYETAIFVTAALVLIGFSFWYLRRRRVA